MSQIWKYPLNYGTTFLDMPVNAEILCVKSQHSQPQLWAKVNPQLLSVTRTIHIVGTGHDIPNDGFHYIGTFMEAQDTLVWHVFEEVL